MDVNSFSKNISFILEGSALKGKQSSKQNSNAEGVSLFKNLILQNSSLTGVSVENIKTDINNELDNEQGSDTDTDETPFGIYANWLPTVENEQDLSIVEKPLVNINFFSIDSVSDSLKKISVENSAAANGEMNQDFLETEKNTFSKFGNDALINMFQGQTINKNTNQIFSINQGNKASEINEQTNEASSIQAVSLQQAKEIGKTTNDLQENLFSSKLETFAFTKASEVNGTEQRITVNEKLNNQPENVDVQPDFLEANTKLTEAKESIRAAEPSMPNVKPLENEIIQPAEMDLKKIELQANIPDINEAQTLNFNPVTETELKQVQVLQNPEPGYQVSHEILSKLEQKGPMEFKLQLEPENLGQIDIKLKLNDGKLVIDIMAASSKTQSLLLNQVDKLVQSLGLQNVQVESIQVSQSMNQQSQDSQNQSFVMNSEMNFSQRKQQDQSNDEFTKQQNLNNNLDAKSDTEEIVGGVDSILSLRSNSQRMNYAV